ncbi:hypothetical protein DSL92_06640 [Billgrantia gudaonensis]|uniref:DSBA-like thioredoxin domain-containing protein n=1 Tax=Billgrantia gudaonensis TaxID=376427 RepID=A0A3S0NWS3_9GAMM|nr:hypothetical protein DSL92_06640 [Halomonas gudaonensis]
MWPGESRVPSSYLLIGDVMMPHPTADAETTHFAGLWQNSATLDGTSTHRRSVMPTTGPLLLTHVSPWSYLGHARLRREIAARHGASVDYVPINAERHHLSQDRRRAAARCLERQAGLSPGGAGWRWVPRPAYPRGSPGTFHRRRPAARLALTAKAHGHDIATPAGHSDAPAGLRERDIADPATLVEIATACGLDGQRLLEEAEGDAGQQRLDAACQAALADGCFGAPGTWSTANPSGGRIASTWWKRLCARLDRREPTDRHSAGLSSPRRGSRRGADAVVSPPMLWRGPARLRRPGHRRPEWVGEAHYGRTFHWGRARGHFTAEHRPEHHAFR